jgi:hypothetical protein
VGKIKGLSKILNCQRITQKKSSDQLHHGKTRRLVKKTMPHSTTLPYPLHIEVSNVLMTLTFKFLFSLSTYNIFHYKPTLLFIRLLPNQDKVGMVP